MGDVTTPRYHQPLLSTLYSSLQLPLADPGDHMTRQEQPENRQVYRSFLHRLVSTGARKMERAFFIISRV